MYSNYCKVYLKLKAFTCSIILFLSACVYHSQKKVSFHKAAELRFRRSYAAVQFSEVTEAELDSIEKSNPGSYEQNDTALLLQLRVNEVLDSNYNLIRSVFQPVVKYDFELTSNMEKIKCRLVPSYDKGKTGIYNLVTDFDGRQSSIEIEGHYNAGNADIKYLLLDVIPGGCKEVVILNEYYIMNGDNSDLYIYEIKQN